MASQQMHRKDPSKKVKEREDDVEADGKESFGEKERELVSDRSSSGNKEVERESGGGKFERKGEENKGLGEKDKLEGRTKVVEGKVWNEEDKRRNNPSREKVEAEKARPREEAQREKDETEEGGGGREENEELSLEDISKYRAEAQQKSMNAVEAAKKNYERKREIEGSKERNKQANEEEKDLTKVKGEEGNVEGDKGRGVLNAIGETIAEIAETTRIMVSGEGQKEKPKSPAYEHTDMKLD
ncbi:hypothetical protein DEO72_LG3g795 [Vigna unguiculata]|uniref:Uncharacterized protein n=1 Tax=Vigna unguiculata TaxID=3917 RepID=A0A4D6LDD4_VIGUN|nr:hypothetical protein DEO72_LG3g795 [Vigna unguiculata]